jgi:glycine/D-amino acid oxidase-like deaminating enzyme
MVEHARAVIIGGGVGGTSIAYHLTELRSSTTLTRMMMYGAALYQRLTAETGVDVSWHEVGSLRLASTKERYEELRRQVGWAKTLGLPLELITWDPEGVRIRS